MLHRHDLTDEEWARLEPLLPDQTPRRGGRWADHRTILNGMFWRTRCGVPWRDVPPSFGSWKTVYNRHRRWSGDGTLVGILDELRRERGPELAELLVDERHLAVECELLAPESGGADDVLARAQSFPLEPADLGHLPAGWVPLALQE